MTQEEILQMDERAVDYAVAAQVMGWTRVASVSIGTARVDAGWLEETGRGGDVDAPHFLVRALGATPDFSLGEWPMLIVARMGALGFAFSVSDGSVMFSRSASARAKKADGLAGMPLGEAIRRAALAAVQS